MTDNNWEIICHALITIIGMLPAVIAAVSSLRNGKTLADQNGRGSGPIGPSKEEGPESKFSSSPETEDWYKPPNLN